MNERYARGEAALQRVTGMSGPQVMARLEKTAPDLGRWIVEFCYGEVASRPGLDPKLMEITAVAAMAALGTAEPQLKVHLNGALNVGVSRDELVEIMQVVAVFAGFPAALNGVFALEDVLKERDEA